MCIHRFCEYLLRVLASPFRRLRCICSSEKTHLLSSPESVSLQVYLAWVNAWLHAPSNDDHGNKSPPLDINTISTLLRDLSLDRLQDSALLFDLVTSFQRRFNNGEITLGGAAPPSCDETNLLSEKYDPHVVCACDGISPMSRIKDADLASAKACGSIAKMVSASEAIINRSQEWNGQGFFTIEKLQAAVEEMAFCSFNIQTTPTICSGASINSIPPIQAPDRRPSEEVDSPPGLFNEYFPTQEKIKICVDAKYFYSIACGVNLVDEAILLAIADTGNDVLIADYYDAATPDTIDLLHKSGAAAVAFLKLYNLTGVISDWQLSVLIAAHLHFRVLGYYRNHAVPKLPEGLYGSRMTGITTHRQVDIAITVGIVSASLATGEELSGDEYTKLVYGCALVNDLVDLRSDTMRKQRENTILRGVRGSVCQYLNKQIRDCITVAAELIGSKRLFAIVVMAFCNWAVMSTHHKLYELVQGVRGNTELEQCDYDDLKEPYDRLQDALRPYGSLEGNGPHWGLRRRELDILYSNYRHSSKTHLAWLADMTRILLNPMTFRKIIDVVHYPWTGETGDVGFCP